jgi:hypothetical protein
MASEAGKGSARRPSDVSSEEWNNRWDAIFGRDEDSEHYLNPDIKENLEELAKISQELGGYE